MNTEIKVINDFEHALGTGLKYRGLHSGRGLVLIEEIRVGDPYEVNRATVLILIPIGHGNVFTARGDCHGLDIFIWGQLQIHGVNQGSLTVV